MGEMTYDVVIVPSLSTIRRTTLDALKNFRKAGGEVIFMGSIPEYVDAEKCDDTKEFADTCTRIGLMSDELMKSLEKYRTIRITDQSGEPYSNSAYQLRDCGEEKYLFLSHVYKPRDYNISSVDTALVTIRGEWAVKKLDTHSGEIRPLPAK